MSGKSAKNASSVRNQNTTTVSIGPDGLQIGEYWITDLFEFRGRDFVLGIDKASQYMFVEELKNKKTETVTKALEKFALTLGLPTVLKSDGGPCFK